MSDYIKSDDIEEKILEQMSQAGKEGNEDLNVSDRENVQELEQEEIKHPALTKQSVLFTLNQIKGFKFKFGEAVFEIKYINPSKGRFSAEILNEVK